jgi:hypothetical protein
MKAGKALKIARKLPKSEHMGESRDPEMRDLRPFVQPAALRDWIPAFAGMTNVGPILRPKILCAAGLIGARDG